VPSNAAAGAARARLRRFPWRSWKDVIVRTYRRIQDNGVLAVAAGVAFYSLVALFPAIAAGVSSYALFANVATISKHLSIASDIIPAGSLDLLSAEITRIAAKSDGKLPIAQFDDSSLRFRAVRVGVTKGGKTLSTPVRIGETSPGVSAVGHQSRRRRRIR
jgi:hypothetical protein